MQQTIEDVKREFDAFKANKAGMLRVCYPNDLKNSAVTLCQDGRNSKKEIALSLGISPRLLQFWCKERGKKMSLPPPPRRLE